MTVETLIETLDLPERFPFPYLPEQFTPEEEQVLNRFFTNVDRPVFAIHGLPQEVVGAMFSRYSRVEKSVRRVFLDEFWKSPELGMQNITDHLAESGDGDVESARARAEKFYRRVFAEYGDDSVIQMGGVHVAFEGVSQIAAKAIEDQRIGAAYIEKSTRYVDFGGRVSGHFLFMEEPELMKSPFAEEFLRWNNAAFEAYNRHLPTAVDFFRQKYPIENQVFLNPKTGEEISYSDILDDKEKQKAERAYERALKAKAFDTVRVFLPATTVTNLGAHFSGQAAENTVNKMMASEHGEVRMLGFMAYQELMKVAPSFFQNVDHRHGKTARAYLRDVREKAKTVALGETDKISERGVGVSVRLVDWDSDADVKIAAQYIYTRQGKPRLSKAAILDWARGVKEKELREEPNLRWSPHLTVQVIGASMPDRSATGLSRRNKLPRAFEHADAEVEFNVDFGIYRDLQRNRMSSTERLPLSADEVTIPREFKEEGIESVLTDYLQLAAWTRSLNTAIQNSGDKGLSEVSEYVTLFGNKMRFNVRANIRQWVFFAELRTIEGGHPSYRRALQIATRQIGIAMPFLKHLFTHVNWEKDVGLGRLRAEINTQNKLGEAQ